MRISHSLSIAALALIPVIASAQTATPPEVVALGTGPNGGSIDFGVRGTSVSGEPARYERYRDLSDGAFLGALRVNREANGWVMAVGASSSSRRLSVV